MYYYDIDDFEITKYEVQLDTKKLSLLKHQIINDCSKVIHKNYETINISDYLENDYIKNYIAKKIGKKDENNNDIYLVSYDFYNAPYLVVLIDSLLNGNTCVINEIKDYKECFFINNPEKSEKYNALLNKINSKEDVKIYGVEENVEDKIRRKELLKQIESLLNDYESERAINYDIDKLNKYRFLVLNCIKFKEIKKLSVEKFIDVQSFFEDSKENILSEKLQKVIKR